MIAKIFGVKMLMWEKTLMKESVMSKDKDNKTIFTKTAKDIEHTTYTFRDITGDKVIFLSKNNTFRDLEGKECNIEIGITFDEFKRKNRIGLSSVEKAKN